VVKGLDDEWVVIDHKDLHGVPGEVFLIFRIDTSTGAPKCLFPAEGHTGAKM
jgi:hypothetical protein